MDPPPKHQEDITLFWLIKVEKGSDLRAEAPYFRGGIHSEALVLVACVYPLRQSLLKSVPERFLEVAQITLREFFNAIIAGKDVDPSWKKAIYKVICKLDTSNMVIGPKPQNLVSRVREEVSKPSQKTHGECTGYQKGIFQSGANSQRTVESTEKQTPAMGNKEDSERHVLLRAHKGKAPKKRHYLHG
ncbi:hypothetical protein A6R68_06647 [Neotoma lepida]|uniref:Prospero domain-containing protein n=1 Tax=Neotoma lepida TaxID=56216 RepID=A0A1A6GGA6_NEOLE|nr:hypothetical protein A6R68_06647 [Neotoma lepida]